MPTRTEDYEKGFRDAVAAAGEVIGRVPIETGSQPDPYSGWVFTDRRARDVRQDCFDAVAALKPRQD